MRAPLFFALLALIGGCKKVESVAEASPDRVTAEPLKAAPAGAVPVLVELFTSEGCSSCPPADANLAKLEKTQPVSGAYVVPLGLHVDYWDRLGWKDPFSDSAWSDRQRAYAPLGTGSYTPQAVIDGSKDVVGSRGSQLEKAVEEAAKKPHATIAIVVAEKDVTLVTSALPAGAASDAELILAVVQAAARIDVPRGENGGQTLDHTAIVRKLQVVGKMPASGATLKTTVERAENDKQRLVAFVQEKASRKVLGTAVVDL